MNSPFVAIYDAISARLKAGLTATESRQIDLDLGQMEAYDPEKGQKPALSFPAQLIDFETTNFKDEGEHIQRAETIILIRACFQQISATDSLTPQQWRNKGLGYLEIEWKINTLLHTWSPGTGYGYLTRIGAVTENRPDNYRVRQIRYKLSFTDKSCLIPLPMTESAYEIEIDLKRQEEE